MSNALEQFGKKEKATDSHVAMLKGLIALAWIDGNLHKDEIDRLQRFIDDNINLNASQRQQLHQSINQHQKLEEVWPEITDLHDRAHLLNIATLIFWEDMEFCEAEKRMFEAMHEWHIKDLDHGTLKNDLLQMSHVSRLRWSAQERELNSGKSFIFRAFDYLGLSF
jgi:uncharacterized tellurite resistance protein B-like protein